MQTIKDTVVSTLETVKDHIEARDESVKKRKSFFLPPIEPEDSAAEIGDLKRVSLDLLDIGMYYGQNTVD